MLSTAQGVCKGGARSCEEAGQAGASWLELGAGIHPGKPTTAQQPKSAPHNPQLAPQAPTCGIDGRAGEQPLVVGKPVVLLVRQEAARLQLRLIRNDAPPPDVAAG